MPGLQTGERLVSEDARHKPMDVRQMRQGEDEEGDKTRMKFKKKATAEDLASISVFILVSAWMCGIMAGIIMRQPLLIFIGLASGLSAPIFVAVMALYEEFRLEVKP